MIQTPIGEVVSPDAIAVLGASEGQNGTVTSVTAKTASALALPKAPLVRRFVADAVDRLVPLPFIAAFFPPWIVVAVLYDLFCDARGGTVGKRLLCLKTVIVSHDPAWHGRDCTVFRSLLRNLPVCVTRFCYLSLAFAPLVFLLDTAESFLAVFRKDGRRLGDLLAGTQVVVKEKGASV